MTITLASFSYPIVMAIVTIVNTPSLHILSLLSQFAFTIIDWRLGISSDQSASSTVLPETQCVKRAVLASPTWERFSSLLDLFGFEELLEDPW